MAQLPLSYGKQPWRDFGLDTFRAAMEFISAEGPTS